MLLSKFQIRIKIPKGKDKMLVGKFNQPIRPKRKDIGEVSQNGHRYQVRFLYHRLLNTCPRNQV